MHLFQDPGRHDEDAGADHRSDDERRGVEARNRPDELDPLRLDRGSSHEADNLVVIPDCRYLCGPPRPPEIPCVSCRAKKSFSICSPKSPLATKKPSSICGSSSRLRPTGARPMSKPSSGWSTKPIRSRTKSSTVSTELSLHHSIVKTFISSRRIWTTSWTQWTAPRGAPRSSASASHPRACCAFWRCCSA